MQEPSMLRREASIATRLSLCILESVIKHFSTGFDRTCRLILSVLHTPYVCGTSDKVFVCFSGRAGRSCQQLLHSSDRTLMEVFLLS